ncbi:cytochrome P450 3A19-like [Tachypleus tridentatus]|uniref:cytochrome P450 3A19-like n=1 Tax=Tachypleus tridentatus TaxID=6853 RepID=UPI003FD6B1E7
MRKEVDELIAKKIYYPKGQQGSSVRFPLQPSGMTVQVPVHHLHYDPSLWPNPEKFDPERFSPDNRPKINPLSWQPFGQGPRNCTDMPFAQMEVKHVLAGILHNYHLVPCEKTEKRLTIKYATVTQSPLKGVYAKFLPRTHQE